MISLQSSGTADPVLVVHQTRPMSSNVFPFGQPVLPRPPSATSPRPVYLLGAYPSGLHVQWASPAIDGQERRSIRAVIVDNEPTPFWDGTDEEHCFSEWTASVAWDQKPWGDATLPPRGTNGSSGRWVAEHVLDPLGLGWDEVCISDCLDTARLNKSQQDALTRVYQPVAGALDLPAYKMLPGPGETEIVQEAEDHCERLRQELRDCGSSTVITLGNAALRVMGTVLDTTGDRPRHGGLRGRPLPPGPPTARLVAEGYGTPLRVPFDDKVVTWLPLLHPGQRARKWRGVHAHWEEAQRKRRSM